MRYKVRPLACGAFNLINRDCAYRDRFKRGGDRWSEFIGPSVYRDNVTILLPSRIFLQAIQLRQGRSDCA